MVVHVRERGPHPSLSLDFQAATTVNDSEAFKKELECAGFPLGFDVYNLSLKHSETRSTKAPS